MSVSGAGETKVDGKAHEEGAEICRRGGMNKRKRNRYTLFRYSHSVPTDLLNV